HPGKGHREHAGGEGAEQEQPGGRGLGGGDGGPDLRPAHGAMVPDVPDAAGSSGSGRSPSRSDTGGRGSATTTSVRGRSGPVLSVNGGAGSGSGASAPVVRPSSSTAASPATALWNSQPWTLRQPIAR